MGNRLQINDSTECKKLKGLLAKINVEGTFIDDYEALKYEILIANTVSDLPRPIRNRVIDKILFFAVTKDLLGYCGKINLQKIKEKNEHTLIMLYFNNMKSEEEAVEVIAHEIAHFILKHGNSNQCLNEQEADLQVMKWGMDYEPSLLTKLARFVGL